MKTVLSFFALIALCNTSILSSHADEMANVDHYFSKAKMANMDRSDFPFMMKRLNKETGKDIKLTADWPSFSKCSYDGAEFLGSTNHSMMEFIVNADDATKKKIGAKVKTITYKHTPSAASPTVSLKGGLLTIAGNYERMNWQEGHGLKAQIIDAISK